MRDDSTTYWQHRETMTRSASGHAEMADLRVPGLTVLAHPDPRRIGERSALTALASGRNVALSRLEPSFAAPGATRRRPLADPHLSRQPLQLVPGHDGGVKLVRSSKTRVEVRRRPIHQSEEFSAADLDAGVVLLLADSVALLLHRVDPLPPTDVARHGLVGESAGILAVRQQISRIADLDVPALLRGETGTGKELVAQAIHQASERAGEPFVAVNMGAVPASLAAAELFGATKGAFTGADRKRSGYFSRARGGTLFLDEIGETPGEVQALLLRALETREIQPVGSDTTTRIDLRILAATDAQLEAEIDSGRFRAPLLHRLSGFEIHLPPLRQRLDDLGLLLVHFLHQELEAFGEAWRLDDRKAQPETWLPASIVARLAEYSWPGNVRQLRNVARQLVIHNRGEQRLRMTSQIEELLEPPAAAAEVSGQSVTRPPSDKRVDRMIEEAGERAVVKTLVFTDLVDSLRLIEELGDQRLVEVMSRHDRAVRGLLAHCGGLEIDKSDGFLLLFDRPADAVAFALAMHDRVRTLTGELGVRLESRVGIHLGEVFLRRNTPAEIARGAKPLEVEGLAKPMAARLMALAGANQTLLTRHAVELARSAAERGELPPQDGEVCWREYGPYPFKGLSERIEVFEVGVEGRAPLEAPPVHDRGPSAGDGETPPRGAGAKRRYRSPSEVDEAELLQALRRHDFRLQPAAATLGISRTSLYALIEKSDRVRKPRDLDRAEILDSQRRCDGDLDAMAAELEVSRKGLHRRMTEIGLL